MRPALCTVQAAASSVASSDPVTQLADEYCVLCHELSQAWRHSGNQTQSLASWYLFIKRGGVLTQVSALTGPAAQ